MADQTLSEWLKTVNLEIYQDALEKKLGATEVSHLKLLTKELIDMLDMLPIHRILFEEKLKILMHENQSAKVTENTVTKKESVILPTSTFGRSNIDISHDLLIKDYGEMYYSSPQNFKHRKANEFVLQMCASALWRFTNKWEMFVWARTERKDRCVALTAFADINDIKKESPYFKQQNVMYQLESINKQHRDVILMTENDDDVDERVLKLKKEKITAYSKQLGILTNNAKEATEKIKEKLQLVQGVQGRKEEQAFWLSLSRKAESVVQKLGLAEESVACLVEKCKNIASTIEKDIKRKQQLNSKTQLKRNALAAKKIGEKKLKKVTKVGKSSAGGGASGSLHMLFANIKKCQKEKRLLFKWKCANLKLAHRDHDNDHVQFV